MTQSDKDLSMKITLLPRNESRRSGIDQRHFFYAVNIPERRSDKDRRNAFDRRKKIEHAFKEHE
jgi:hypothetical protein